MNKAGLELIAEFEGFVDHWYPDPAHGWSVPTCCFGHTDAAGAPKYADTKDKVFTRTEGLNILNHDLRFVEARVLDLVKVELNENELAALVSFTYNLGSGNLKKSTLLKKLNTGDREGAAEEFDRWVFASGKKYRGLERRRAAEKKLFLTPVRDKAVGVDLAPIVKTIIGLLKKLFNRS